MQKFPDPFYSVADFVSSLREAVERQPLDLNKIIVAGVPVKTFKPHPAMPPVPPIPPQIRGLIFDFDGTLADTMPLHWRAWRDIAARHGFTFTEERFYALGGVPSREILKQLNCEQGTHLDPIAVGFEKEEAYLRLLDEVRPITEIVAIVRDQAGQRAMAVASGGSRRVIERVLNHLNLRSFFQAVVTNDDVTRHKPAPDVFLEAARRLGVPPAACLAYEDTDLGLQAIQAAGMLAVDVRPLTRNGETA